MGSNGGYSLSQAFRKAWKRVKFSMKVRAVGTTFGNTQERLGFMKQFPVETMQAELCLLYTSDAADE